MTSNSPRAGLVCFLIPDYSLLGSSIACLRIPSAAGIAHSEQNESSHPVHFLQIWAIPWKKSLQPRYHTRTFSTAQKRLGFVPILSPLAAGLGASVEEEAAAEPTIGGTIPIHADFLMGAGVLEPGKTFAWTVGSQNGVDVSERNDKKAVVKKVKGRNVYLHVAMTGDGRAKVKVNGDEGVELGEGDGTYVQGVNSGDELLVESIGEVEAEVVVLDSD